MQCPRCQAENPERARFCEDCGARLELKCPHCGEDATPGKKFCASCGGSLAAAPSSSRPAPSPQDYTPQHLAERIISSRGALEGERKQVTVLFADLKGSMELLADRDPEEARRLLDPVLERMMEAVHRYEGTVNQVMGDGIMALFGAPLAHEDHAVRACYAALRMQEGVKQYADAVRRSEGVLIQIRVGLNSGEVVVRSIGSDLRMDYTAVGQTTHLAARMEQLAAPGSAVLAPDTLSLVEGFIQVKALGAMQVKGLDPPVEVYELLGPGLARSRLQAAVARGLTRFVGRDTELETLRQTLERAGAGHGQLVALVGEPGVGKSRLTWEFTRSHRAQGWRVLEASSLSYGKATAWLPVSDLLRSYFQIEPRDDHRRIRQKVLGAVLDLDRALEALVTPLLFLLDVPVEDAAWEVLDAPQRRQRLLEAVKRLLLRESQEQPVLLVFEDLHWIDSETQALLDSLVESLPTARILLLVNYRPEYEHGWGSKTYYRQLRLDPLPPARAEELLRVLLGADRSLAPLKGLLIERTEGNPFFLEESVRALVETGALAGERGAYRLAYRVERTQVPATVQAVLAARIDRLAPEDKRLLQTAAVVGKDVPYALLHAIAGLSEVALHEGLERLRAAELLYEASLFPELEYTFSHALTHEVTYGGLLQERRRALHAAIVRAVEHLYPDRLAEHVERLAQHAWAGELWADAAAYLQQAGEKAAARSAYQEAVTQFEQALRALDHAPATRKLRERAIDVRIALRIALTAIGERERPMDQIREAVALAAGLGDERRRGIALAALATQYWGTGDQTRAVEAGKQALDIATGLSDPTLLVLASLALGRAYEACGDYHRAAAALNQCIQTDDGRQRIGLGVQVPAVIARAALAAGRAELGQFDEASAVANEAVQLAEAAGQGWSLIVAHTHVGYVAVSRGQLDVAITALTRALERCETWRIPALRYVPSWLLGRAYALAGRTTEAIPLLERTAQEAASGRHYRRPDYLVALGEAHLLAGHPEAARGPADEGLQLSREQGARGSEAWALRLLGEIAAQSDPPDAEQAESYCRQALVLADELGMRPLAAHCHLGLSTLYQKLDRRDQAHAELATAAELYRAMDMGFWLERAEGARARLPR